MRDLPKVVQLRRIKNKYNLPKCIVRAVQNDSYIKGPSDISTTTLIKPPRITQLESRYALDIEEDVSDLVFSLLGQSVHHVIERAALKSDIVEERIFYEGPETNHWKLSGQIDLLQADGSLIDFKVTSAWTAMDALQNNKIEWEQQLNVYDFIASNNDLYPVQSLSIMAILRDWSKLRVMQSDTYPKKQAIMIPIRRWSREEQSNYIKQRISLHQESLHKTTDKLPVCTPAERWSKPTTYAVMKKGRVKAVRVLESEKLAHQYIADNNMTEGKDCAIIRRIGEDVRCEHYCNVKNYCNYYKDKVHF